MRRWSVRTGSLLGIGLQLHVSWFLALAAVVAVTTAGYGDVLPGLPGGERLLMGFATGIAFFAGLVLHELSHAVVARRFGIDVRAITLFLLGGVAEIAGEPSRPGHEFAMALAGPAVSVTLASVCGALGVLLDPRAATGPSAVLITLAAVNLGVAIFNLVPGLPLDGGRILRAALWRRTGSFRRATRIAAATGLAAAAVLVTGGAILAATGEAVGVWYAVMGLFVGALARRAGRAVPPPALAWTTDEGATPQPRT